MERSGFGSGRFSVGKTFFLVFVAFTPIMFAPSRLLPLVGVMIFLLFLTATSRDGSLLRVALVGSVIAASSLVSILIDSQVFGRDVSFPALLIGLFHHLPIILAIAYRPGAIGRETRDRAITWIALIVLIQSLIGIMQFLMFSNSDLVTGTLGHNPKGINQVLFTFNLFIFIVFLFAYLRHSVLVSVAIFFGSVAIVLAQSGHQTVMFLLSLVVATLISRRISLSNLLSVIVFIMLASWLVLTLQPATFTGIAGWYGKTVNPESSIKWAAIKAGFETLQSPKNMILGTGLGQFASRGALLASDTWVQRDMPVALTAKSEYFTEKIEPLLQLHERVGEDSAISKPHFSVLNLFVEMGIFAGLLFCVGFLRVVKKHARLQLSSVVEVRKLAWSINVGLLFFISVSFVENYAEFVQALFLPIMLFMLVKGRIRALQSASP